MGRPTKEPQERRSRRITLYLTIEEEQLIRREARAAFMSLNDWMVRAARQWKASADEIRSEAIKETIRLMYKDKNLLAEDVLSEFVEWRRQRLQEE